MLKVVLFEKLPNDHYLVLRDNTDDEHSSKEYSMVNYTSKQVLNDGQTHWVHHDSKPKIDSFTETKNMELQDRYLSMGSSLIGLLAHHPYKYVNLSDFK